MLNRLLKILPLLTLALAFAAPARAQYTTVTAQVKDSNGTLYNNCQANISFVPSPGATTQPFINGSLFQTVLPVVQCDSNANFTATMADNSQVSDGHASPPASQWNFAICSAKGAYPIQYCFQAVLTITGATQNVTAALTAAPAPILPIPGGGGIVPSTVPGPDYVPISVGMNVVNWKQIAAGLPCGDGSHAVNYSTVTHSFGCQSIAVGQAPGGNNTNVQFNNMGVFGGSNNFAYGLSPDSLFLVADIADGGFTTLYSETIGSISSGSAVPYAGIISSVEISPTGELTGIDADIGLSGQASAEGTSGKIDTVTGVKGLALVGDIAGTGEAGTLVGVRGTVEAGNSGIIDTAAYDFLATAPAYQGGSTTPPVTYGLEIQDMKGHTASAGIHIESQTSPGKAIVEDSGAGENDLNNTVVTGTQSVSGLLTASIGLLMPEIAPPSGVSSNTRLWANSANHWLQFNPNNTGALRVGGISGVVTASDCLEFNDTVGTIVDSGGPCGSGGTGTVTSFACTSVALSPLFDCSVANPNTTPTLTFSQLNAAAHKFFMNNTGGSAAPGFQSPAEADLPATTVWTDTANTFGAHLNDFSAATIKLPVAAGFTVSANGNIGYDSTNNNWHAWTNAADKLVGVWTATPTDGNCVKASVSSSVVLLADAGAACGTGSGPTLQTNSVNNTTQTALNFVNTAGASGINFTNPGTSTESASLASTVGGGNAVLTCTVSGGTQGQYFGFDGTPKCVNITPGVIPDIQTGASYTVLQADLGVPIFLTDSVSIAVTLNAPASYTANFFFCAMAAGTGTVTITASGNINGSGTLAITTKNHACVYNDGSTWYALTGVGF